MISLQAVITQRITVAGEVRSEVLIAVPGETQVYAVLDDEQPAPAIAYYLVYRFDKQTRPYQAEYVFAGIREAR